MTPIYKGCWSGRMFKGPSPSWLYQKNIDWQVRPKSTPEENTRATLYIKENAAYCERYSISVHIFSCYDYVFVLKLLVLLLPWFPLY